MALAYSYDIEKSWNGGFVAEITITNTGDTDIENWQIEFDFAPDIQDVWRGELLQKDGDRYTIQGLSYNDTIDAGESVTIGFKASGDPSNLPVFTDASATDPISPPPPVTEPEPEQTPEETEPEAQPPVTEEPSDGEPVATDPEPSPPPAPAPSPDPSTIIHIDAGTNAQALQKIIDDASPGSVIRLEEGTYRFDRTVEIDRDDISVEGAGSDKTTIITDFASGKEGSAFHIHGDGLTGNFTLDQHVAEGSKTLVLDGGHDFSAGDFVWLERPNTEQFFEEIGDTSWEKDKPLRTSIARITDVDGDTLTLENGIHFDYDVSDAVVRKLEMAENVGLGGFTIESTLGKSDPGDFSNNENDYYRIPTIDVDGSYKARFDDISIYESGSSAFQFKKTLAMTADELYAEGAHNKGSGGNGYAYELKEVYESSLTNLEDHGMRHSLLFASWYSAANNTAHIKYTDRDINFHGGRDHGNTVTVDVSHRIAEYDNMSASVTYNSEGAHYGAPTDANANQLSFANVFGSKRNDTVRGNDDGSYLDGQGAHDTLYGGNGADTLIGGDGRDHLHGGAGVDVAKFSGNFEDYEFTLLDGNILEVDGTDGRDQLYDVEWLEFSDGTRISTALFGIEPSEDPGDVPPPAPEPDPISPPVVEDPIIDDPLGGDVTIPPVTSPPATESPATLLEGTDGNDTFLVDDPLIEIAGGGGWDRVEASVSYELAENTEMLTLIGDDDIDATGNDDRNVLRGNTGDNVLKGEGGDDELWAREGDDRLYGGSGNDVLYGQDGDDILMGGGGADRMEGGSGADTFRFDGVQDSKPGDRDEITDFNSSEGDRFDFSRFDGDENDDGRQSLRYIGEQEFSGEARELRYADGVLSADIDGDGVAEFEVDVVYGTGLESDDFLT